MGFWGTPAGARKEGFATLHCPFFSLVLALRRSGDNVADTILRAREYFELSARFDNGKGRYHNIVIILFVSPDGTTRILRGDVGATQGNNIDGFSTAVAENLAIAEPFLQVQIQTANPPTAWIWCQP